MISDAWASIPPIEKIIEPFVSGHGTWISTVILPTASVVGKGNSGVIRTDGNLENVIEVGGNLGGNPVPFIVMVSAANASDFAH